MELQDLSESTTKEQQTQNTVLNEDKRKTVGCFAPLIIGGILTMFVIPILATVSDKKQAKKHPNIIRAVYSDYIRMQDINDNEERLVATSVMNNPSIANHFRPGDTIYFYDNDYERRLAFQHGTLIYNEDTIQKRIEMKKKQQILNACKTKQR